MVGCWLGPGLGLAVLSLLSLRLLSPGRLGTGDWDWDFGKEKKKKKKTALNQHERTPRFVSHHFSDQTSDRSGLGCLPRGTPL